MFLKSLEIRGFKSFLDKTELDFKQGITAVVGPNGSGKSNVSDAVRWVLGEQSVKTLRGGKMEDVIFAGTQFRKPVGLAQVSLTLDNTDGALPIEYSEVTVSRRIFRSGESEYLINNRQCRLKDITNLFMDTGIGKEGYSLIGQGKIDAILNGRPEERRSLLEEAAGIVKYKTRKEEAEKKLSNTNQNLVRIDDIISTYEERLEPLREQNIKAQQFIEYSGELKQRELSLLFHNIAIFQNEMTKIEEELKQLYGSHEQLKNEYIETKLSLEKLDKQLEEMESLDLEERGTFYKNKEKKQELESEIDILIERLKNIDSLVSSNLKERELLEFRKQELIRQEANFNIELEKKVLEKSDLDKNLSCMEESISKVSREYNYLKNTEIQCNENKLKYIRLISEHNNKNMLVEEQIKNLEDNINQINSSYVSSQDLIKINYSTRCKLEEKIDSLKNEITIKSDSISTKKKNMTNLFSDTTRKENEYASLKDKINKVQANKNILSNLEEQYEGYNKSVKRLFELIDSGKIAVANMSYAILGEIINVKKEYETAVEIALGNAISNVITDNENIAKKLIGELKDRKLGRATFLPLNTVNGKKLVLDKSALNSKGYLGIASELIDFDEKYRLAVEHTLGRTIVCDNMDNALNLAKLLKYSVRIVTLDGEIVNPGGALTGGYVYHKSTSIISRKREIDELALEETQLKAKLENLQKAIKENREKIKVMDEDIINCKEDIHNMNIDIAKLDSEISSLDKESAKLTNAAKLNETQVNNYKMKIEAINSEKVSMDSKIQEIRNGEQLNQERLEATEKQIKLVETEVNRLKEQFTEEKIKRATLEELVNNKKNEIERIQREVSQSDEKICAISKEIDESKINKEQWNLSIESNKQNIESISILIYEIDKKIEQREIERRTTKEQYKIENSKVESLSLQIGKMEENIHKIEVTKARKEQENESYLSQLNEEFELTYAEISDKVAILEDINSVTKEIQKLKINISSLGNVNVAAIEEYKEVTEKYKFMTEQRDDLVNSREELLTVIEEMTQKMRSLFSENFVILNKNFNETFMELFKGGSAQLILGEGDELTSNIEINVQPPGKKLQNINLMSGGEKVLSAIALVFAILKMKPTPFCILDEIEAALDDANVDRYAEFLKKFSNNIQFIVITHRKGTMEASDVMYGVTMQEKGISKVVSVDLTK
ncbi:chromosome segregation protein SMC [Inconstantimicrobium mannanitabidum]|uniref:Chromosome partition protein Smc n=1 Tax=Inconstantimicrobium mannanitabidum TaxID=1604901 RepID=A0ACB5RB96_9CLOT|nr:chromosome segregation protein SMC [Clostridium sp. TW13]GKX66281.1 chromosome partition protein Smc [Clostridium sp. TW13]